MNEGDPGVKNQITIDLADDVPDATAVILGRVSNITVRRRFRDSRLTVNGVSTPLVLVSGGLAPYALATAGMLASLAGENRLGIVVAERLAPHVRRELEAVGCAYADATGAVHIDVPGVMLHIEPGASRGRTRGTTAGGVGVVGVRVVQVMLGDPARDWSVAGLAEAAGCSTGQAHKMLVRLEAEGLVSASGLGPARRRRAVRPGELLDWLASVPSAHRIRERLPVFLYTPDPSGPVTEISVNAARSHLECALTGAAAAAVFGSLVMTAINRVMVRVDPDIELFAAADALRAEPVEGGANMLLVRDLGRLGVHQKAQIGAIAIAPPARIWLDMLSEPRGEDAAALFREAVLGW